jgi:hypothetical protein
MKKYSTLLLPAGLALLVVMMTAFGGGNFKNSGGAPAGFTNSPADGQNCSHCMGGTPEQVIGWITSDIPATGYVPGTTYTFTVTATGTGNKGFEVSPQDISGNLLGTLVAGSGNKLVGQGRYVTHSSASASSTATWNFQWKAPGEGEGDITFYAALAVGKLNTKLETYTVSQSTLGIVGIESLRFRVYPNPATDRITVSGTVGSEAITRMEIINLAGETVGVLAEEAIPAGIFSKDFRLCLPPGIYILTLTQGNARLTQRFVKL